MQIQKLLLAPKLQLELFASDLSQQPREFMQVTGRRSSRVSEARDVVEGKDHNDTPLFRTSDLSIEIGA